MELLIGNDQTITVDGLRDEVSGDYINDATVQATIKTARNVEVEGQSWPLTLEYVADSNGQYRGTIESAVELTPNKRYVLEVTATQGSLEGFWRESVPAIYRQFS